MESRSARKTSSKAFRRWMAEGRLSYERVASALGVHPITVRNWEKNGIDRIGTIAFTAIFRRQVIKKTAAGLKKRWETEPIGLSRAQVKGTEVRRVRCSDCSSLLEQP